MAAIISKRSYSYHAVLAFAAASALCAPFLVEAGFARSKPQRVVIPGADPFPSTYHAAPAPDFAITNATVLTAAGPILVSTTVVVSRNHIVAIGRNLELPPGIHVIDGSGKWVTPGLIDGHTHLGSVSIPSDRLSDGMNEASDADTAEVYVENSVWAQSPEFPRLRAAGVTSFQVLPGSTNVFGGHTVVLKNVNATTVQAMKFPGASYGIKMACGENPARFYGGQGRAPRTRAGVIAQMRRGFATGQQRLNQLRKAQASSDPHSRGDDSGQDLQADALAGLADGSVRINVHCYRSDDMANVIDAAREFGMSVSSFHHATEAFKIIPLLKAAGPCILTWGGPDWGGFKHEAIDYSPLQVPMLDRTGVCVAVTSDSGRTGQHLNLDAARSMVAGQRAGLAVGRADAIRWITINPARALGISAVTGSLEVGKAADIVVWSGDPFSVYGRPEQVFIDGTRVFAAGVPGQMESDFDLGRGRKEPGQ